MGFFGRETMETAQDFNSAVNKLAYTQLIAPGYFIVGGTKPGEVGFLITVFDYTIQTLKYRVLECQICRELQHVYGKNKICI